MVFSLLNYLHQLVMLAEIMIRHVLVDNVIDASGEGQGVLVCDQSPSTSVSLQVVWQQRKLLQGNLKIIKTRLKLLASTTS